MSIVSHRYAQIGREKSRDVFVGKTGRVAIMERRDHVLITFLEPDSFCASTFLMRWSSTNGPFFRLRGIC